MTTDPSQRADRRACISLLVLGILCCCLARVFAGQLVMLDRIAGGDRFASTTILFYSVVGFGSLLLLVLTPWWWLFAISRRRVEESP